MTIHTWGGISVSMAGGEIRVVPNDNNVLIRHDQLVEGGAVSRKSEGKRDCIDLDWVATELNNNAFCRGDTTVSVL
jgi:hypothetical protein